MTQPQYLLNASCEIFKNIIDFSSFLGTQLSLHIWNKTEMFLMYRIVKCNHLLWNI